MTKSVASLSDVCIPRMMDWCQLCSKQVYSRAIQFDTEMKHDGALRSDTEAQEMVGLYQEAIEELRDHLVEVILEEADRLNLQRDPALESAMTTTFDAVLLPVAKEWEMELEARGLSQGRQNRLNLLKVNQPARERFRLFALATRTTSMAASINDLRLKDVELAFRELVREKYREKHGRDWLEKLQSDMDTRAIEAANATMKQRRAYSPQDFLHFTQLRDVRGLISERWQDMFHSAFKIDRREFNRLSDTVLKGRTEQAHHRPEHLFSSVEKERVHVAAHDLLESLIAGERLVRESARAYFPYIRATQFLYKNRDRPGDDEGLLLKIMETLFSSIEVAIENAIEKDTFAELVEAARFTLIIGTEYPQFETGPAWANMLFSAVLSIEEPNLAQELRPVRSNFFVITRDRRFVASPAALNKLDAIFTRLRSYAEHGQGPRIYGESDDT